MFASSSRESRLPSAPRGHRAYVVGDVHGRLDLLEHLLERIEADLTRRPVRKTLLAFVGDLIDRGPHSAQVVERLRTYRRPGIEPLFILGNHEEVLLRILAGNGSLIDNWCRFGGKECLQSYGVAADDIHGKDALARLAIVRRAIPQTHIQFLKSFHDTCRFGDYLFVHAGVRPGVELEQQSQADLRWIRGPFLYDDTDHGFVVVHGHTISPQVEERSNRIGIDTGAYRTGCLTALVLDGIERRLIDTRAAESGADPESIDSRSFAD
jgi:serine/threonine protein phosphatase 1